MRPPSILLVEDDSDVREILAETLKDEGFAVATAVNGLEALKVLRSSPIRPSVILLDLMMPVLDGYGFLEERRKDPLIAAIPVAIVTAGQGVDRARAGEDTMVIPKPIDVPRLVGVINELISRSEAGA
jgi:CheY-like chemotaxis protein